MAVFNEPTKWQTSLVNTGDANVIPQSTPVGTGEASFDDGFPQITQIPIGAGGIAPDRKDFNGLFKILGDWIFFNQNGGVSTYSENFDYVAGRVVLYNGNIYKCIQANGVSSTVVAPDSNTEYWQRIDNFVRSVNGVDADTQGNVNITSDYTVRLVSTRKSTGDWTITGLTPYKPLIICYVEPSLNRTALTPKSGTMIDGNTAMVFGQGDDADTSTVTLIPTNSTVVFTVATTVNTSCYLMAYQ